MIDIENISFKFEKQELFSDFSLKVEKGEKVILKSPSGRGKSTLFKLIVGFLKPNSGKIFVNGLLVEPRNLPKIRESIAYVPQSLSFKNMKISQVIEEIYSYSANRDKKLDKKQLQELLAQFNMEKDVLDKEYMQLSGGERQRITLIIVFLMNKDILLLDETTASLDQEMKEIVMRYLEEGDKTVLMITHDTVENLKGFKVIVI